MINYNIYKRGWEDDDGLDQLDEDDESLDKRGMPLCKYCYMHCPSREYNL